MKIINYLWGFTRVEIKGTSEEIYRLLKICQNAKIKLFDLHFARKEVEISKEVKISKEDGFKDNSVNKNVRINFSINWNSIENIEVIANKIGIDYIRKETIGVVYYLNKYRNRVYLLFLCVLIVLIINYLNSFLFHIEIQGNTLLTKEEFIDFLNDENCYIGCKISDIDVDELEIKARNNYPFISWICIKINGNSLIVQVLENRYLSNNEILQNTKDCEQFTGQYYSSISKEEGTISNLFIRNGISNYKMGDLIYPGDIVVTGKIPIYNTTADEIIDYNILYPDFDLQIETSIYYDDEIDFAEKNVSTTGQCVLYPYILLNNRYFNLKPSENDNNFYNSYMIKKSFHQVHLFEDYYLPIYYGNLIYDETSEYISFRDYATLVGILLDNYEDYLSSLADKGIVLISEQHSFIECNDGLKISATLDVIKDAECELQIND